jgi:hypothetical protein
MFHLLMWAWLLNACCFRSISRDFIHARTIWNHAKLSTIEVERLAQLAIKNLDEIRLCLRVTLKYRLTWFMLKEYGYPSLVPLFLVVDHSLFYFILFSSLSILVLDLVCIVFPTLWSSLFDLISVKWMIYLECKVANINR